MTAQRSRGLWLFSPATDLCAFAAPVVLSLLACLLLSARGALAQPLGAPGWLLTVVLVDVAHVYATIYRVYAVPAELRRRPWLYATVPLVCYALAVLAYAAAPLIFWRLLAYVAVFHFVRQQRGWVALARRREPSPPRRGWLDGLAVYAGTLYPLLWWHIHLPRRFHWFIAGDFLGPAPRWLLPAATALWAATGLGWLASTVAQSLRSGCWNWAKLIIMIGTWATWYLGIVHWDSDIAFTLTNVMAHGVPYLIVVHRYHVRRLQRVPGAAGAAVLSFALFYLPLLALAYAEEGVWDRLVWHDHAALFPGGDLDLSALALGLLVPLLALPQATHYVLDAWIWRFGGQNPDLARHLDLAR